MIDAAQWRDAVSEIAHEGFEMLTCVDRAQGKQLWLRTRNGTSIATEILDGEVAPSIADIFPAASWKEREIHDMFGVNFDAEASNVSLFEINVAAPLRKNALLKNRNTIAWPGIKDPSDSATSPSRRKSLPIGVNPEAGELL